MRVSSPTTAFLFVLPAISMLAVGESYGQEASPKAKALAFLEREVPRWPVEKKCFSCHNSGDGLRALLAASRHQHPVPPAALRDTLAWLKEPDKWDQREEKNEPREKTLARIHFASVLLEAHDAGVLRDHKPLRRAADLVAELQQGDGSWWVEEEGSLGSPVTYGVVLATHEARRFLQCVYPGRYEGAIAKAGRWLQKRPVRTVFEAASLLLALEGIHTRESAEQKRQGLELIRKGEDPQGGWGPYTNSPPEPFDTAVVLIALSRSEYTANQHAAIRRGRAYLLSVQRKDGSWPETTRPAGSESYAQRISTTAWVTRALLATE